jgi:NitT/TauT family transport system permease protein/taurine transport system permease protein
VLPFILLLVAWWASSAALHLSATVLPSPVAAARDAGPLLTEGILPDYATASLKRILFGGGLGIVFGIPAGLILGSNRLLSVTFTPFLKFFQALSGIAWLPMVLVWFGFTEKTIQAVILYTAFFPIAFNTMVGLRTVPPRFAEAVRTLGARRWRLVTDVWLPGSLPSIIVGIRLGIAYGWRALIAGEMVVGAGGMGFLLFQSRSFHQTARIIDGMVVIGLLWVFLDTGFLRPVERYTVERWGMEQR